MSGGMQFMQNALDYLPSGGFYPLEEIRFARLVFNLGNNESERETKNCMDE